MPTTPSLQIYGSIEFAVNFFRDELFSGEMPEVVIRLINKSPKIDGYHAPATFVSRTSSERSDEIGLNPVLFHRPLLEILVTLVHQMTHAWLHHYGSPSRAGYHNRQWSQKMKSIGLQPSNTGKKGGKEIGQVMSQYIIANGQFEEACRKLLAAGFDVRWKEAGLLVPRKMDTGKSSEAPSKRIAWVCPKCTQRAWAKPTANLMCGDCQRPLRPEK